MPLLTEDFCTDVRQNGEWVGTLRVHVQFDLEDPFALTFMLLQAESYHQQTLAVKLFRRAFKRPGKPQGKGAIKVIYMELEGVVSVEFPNSELGPFQVLFDEVALSQYLTCIGQLVQFNQLKKQYLRYGIAQLLDQE
ncbi:MAG TPA: hypothetical protein VLF64_03255 [Candidatus Saccharimonadales bacterium]|nr:hypothetical protein [Candidatus Saccharimonadales bacterium]